MKRSTLPALSACVLGAGLAIAAAAPGGAQTPPPPTGASVTLDRTCYAPGDAITETARGFTPNAQVLETLALLPTSGGTTPLDIFSATHTADAAGNFTARLRAPRLARDSDRREIAGSVFTDQTPPPAPAPGTPPAEPPLGPTVVWTLSAWDVDIPQWESRRADPARKMTVDAFGWTVTGRSLYAHYYRGTTRIRSVRIGALTGQCGDLRRTVPQFPFKRVKAGEWRIFFSATAILDKGTDDWVRRTVIVPRSKATA
jgi:hypothetical protein